MVNAIIEERSSVATPTARQRILAVACDLFYRHGIRAVGIDTIIAAAGVAKMSLYRAFPSKDDLVAAYLEERSRQFWVRWDGVIAAYAGKPRRTLEALLDAITARIVSDGYRGCPFLNTATEFPGDDLPAKAIIHAYRKKVNFTLHTLAAEAGAGDPQALADHLQLVIDGAYCAGQDRASGAGKSLPLAGRILIAAALM